MSHVPHQTVVVQQSPSTSGLAIAGLIFSILGWFTCGLLCIPGAFLCFLALFSRGPKGTALAGLIVGFPGTLFFAFVGLGMIMGFLGLGAAATTAVREAERAQTQAQTQPATSRIPEDMENPTAESVPEPSTEQPNKIELDIIPETQPNQMPTPSASTPDETPSTPPQSVVDQPALQPENPDPTDVEAAKWRTWTTADGKFKVEAKFVSFTAGKLKLEKKDGKSVDVQIDILCSDDQEFVRDRKWMKPIGNQ